MTNMKFLGSVRLDGSKRLTIIKEVAEIMQVDERSHVMFYIDNGEIIIKKVLPNHGVGIQGADEDFADWVRKRKIEISMEDPSVQDELMEGLNERIEQYKDYQEMRNQNF